MAGMVWGYLHSLSLEDTARAASAAATMAVEGAETINPLLCEEEVRRRVAPG